MLSFWKSALRGSNHPHDRSRIRSLFLLTSIVEECGGEYSGFVVPIDVVGTSILSLYPLDARVECVLRYRPKNSREIQIESLPPPAATGDEDEPVSRPLPPTNVPTLGPETTNAYLFERYGGDLVDTFLDDGRDSCLWTYGSTGTGKTHTLFGCNDDDVGMVSRMLQYMETRCREGGMMIEMSIVEVYNEKVYDRLVADGQSLRVRTRPETSSPYVEGLTWHPLNDSNAWGNELIQKAHHNRMIWITQMGYNNVRSFKVYEFRLSPEMGPTTRLSVVDCMSSDRSPKNGSLPESRFLRKSVVSICNVVNYLFEITTGRTTREFVPYRDSAVTYILKHTLGRHGCRTVVIGTLSMSLLTNEEAISTVKLLDRWSQISL